MQSQFLSSFVTVLSNTKHHKPDLKPTSHTISVLKFSNATARPLLLIIVLLNVKMADAPLLELSSSKALQSTEQMQLLDIVDSLRAQGLSEFTALPQLIVCGDQSSGKSSVLEAISGVPFPRQDNLCTRFATEVILRRDATEGISVSIVPAKDRIEADTLRLRQFHHVLASRNDFPGLFDKAKDAMGLSDTAKSFSKDVLRVEIRGPGQPQLTLVDLPGLIHTATKSQTKGDVELVKQLVTEYMGKRRSIILAVVSAKNDVGNQVVLERAREVDLLGQRTMGIITKPDTLHKGSSNETAFINLARNWDVKLELGWHVVKNLDSSTVDFGHNKRDEEESSFFEESNFKTLPAHNIGIAALRSRLSKVPFNHIRTELPRLGNEIDKKIHLCDFELKRMGTARVTPEQQRAFLIELSQSFQTICRDAVQGNYDSAFFTDNNESERRLCAVLMNLHLEFGEQLRTDGARWIVKDKKDHFDKKSRSREEAVDEACKLLRRSRGREVPTPELFPPVALDDMVLTVPSYSSSASRILALWATCSASIVVHGKILLGNILSKSGRIFVNSQRNFCSISQIPSWPMLFSSTC